MLNNLVLEDMATTLREMLNFDSETILNQTHLKELSKKIEEHFECYKIITGEDGPLLILDNENFFTIYICGNEETQFYDLVRMFTFSILLDDYFFFEDIRRISFECTYVLAKTDYV